MDGEVDGEVEGEVDGELDGEVEGDGEDDGDGDDGVVGTTPPVHTVPFKANDDGTGFDPVHDPLNPNDAAPPVATAPFHPALRTVTVDPDWDTEPFQS
ncbi:hypothetical protein [Actinoplanes sp. GCM10030250]|uniref:hypothetical protein n=1 Tax=Actinoplanes sp. GCM10030250 TaxID=3273376 RepID=UPI003607E677